MATEVHNSCIKETRLYMHNSYDAQLLLSADS
jgi:hypothetical protein